MSRAIGAVILSAGDSARMGRTKALLEIAGKTFLERCLDLAAAAGLDPVRVVVGRNASEIARALPAAAPLLVRNPQPELGQLRSLQLGISALGDGAEGVVVQLIDHPLVRAETVARLLAACGERGRPVTVPVFKGRRGHPVFYSREAMTALMEAPLEEGARWLHRTYPEWIAEEEVDDPAVCSDVDTPEDYRRLVEMADGRPES